MKILLDRGANVNSKRNDGSTPLHEAAAYGNSKNIESEIQMSKTSIFSDQVVMKRSKFSSHTEQMFIQRIILEKVPWIGLSRIVITKELGQKFRKNVKTLSFLCSGKASTLKILVNRGADDIFNSNKNVLLSQAASSGNSKRIGSQI